MSVMVKTEHGGPKKGKGFWGRKEEAKRLSKKKRRSNDKKAIKEE
jgi:hypothetical protein